MNEPPDLAMQRDASNEFRRDLTKAVPSRWADGKFVDVADDRSHRMTRSPSAERKKKA